MIKWNVFAFVSLVLWSTSGVEADDIGDTFQLEFEWFDRVEKAVASSIRRDGEKLLVTDRWTRKQKVIPAYEAWIDCGPLGITVQFGNDEAAPVVDVVSLRDAQTLGTLLREALCHHASRTVVRISGVIR